METLTFLMATTFYPPYHLGGDAVHVRYLAEALAAQGHEVHVEFSPAAYRLKRRTVPESPTLQSAVHVHPIPSAFGRGQPIAAHVAGRSGSVSRFHERLAAQVRPDVVHLHNISLLGLGVLRRVPGATMLYTAHDYWARCPRSDLRRFGGESCDRPTCTSCAIVSHRPPQLWRYARGWRGFPTLDAAIAPSRYMASAIAPALACPVVHIPNFTPDRNPHGVRFEPDDYLLYVGVLERHKGLLALATAASGPGSWRVRIVGSGSLHDHLATLERRGARLHVEGWVSEERLDRLYREAAALVVPSIWDENAPLVAIEALSWGTPLLASLRGGLTELLYNGSAGLPLDPTAAGLSAAIERYRDEGLHHLLRPFARRAYETNHRPDRYLGRYLDVVRRLNRGDPRAATNALSPRANPLPVPTGGGSS